MIKAGSSGLDSAVPQERRIEESEKLAVAALRIITNAEERVLFESLRNRLAQDVHLTLHERQPNDIPVEGAHLVQGGDTRRITRPKTCAEECRLQQRWLAVGRDALR